MNPSDQQYQPQPVTQPEPTPPTSTPPTAPVSATYPGKGLGIASMIVSIIGAGLIGLILGIVAFRQSKKAGFGNGFAIAGIIIGIVNILLAGALIAFFATAAATVENNSTCTKSTAPDGTVSTHCTVN